MGKNTGPSCKQCRREGMKLFLKGQRCTMSKCAMEVGRAAPGMHGQRRGRKMSDYGSQLREKQKLRRQYGLREGQFKLAFTRASRRHGVTGEMLLQTLETRLDNVVYRLGFASSRREARQFVTHRHVLVDGHKATIASMPVKVGSVVQVKDKTSSREKARMMIEANASREVPAWMKREDKEMTGTLLRIPSREEIAPVVNEQLIVELYSK